MPAPGALEPAVQHTLKGGVFHADLRFGMLAGRYPFEANARQYNVGFRLCCSWPPVPEPNNFGE